MKRKKIDAEYLYNGWLRKYHNITVEWLVKNEPELIKTPDWYKKYAVTSAQHDEWYEWAITELCKASGISSRSKRNRELARRNFCFDYLNIAPSIIETDDNNIKP